MQGLTTYMKILKTLTWGDNWERRVASVSLGRFLNAEEYEYLLPDAELF